MLFGLGLSVEDEVRLQAFRWGQLGLPISAFTPALHHVDHFGLSAGRWAAASRSVIMAFSHGRQAHPLLPAYWELRWEQSLMTLRVSLLVRPFR